MRSFEEIEQFHFQSHIAYLVSLLQLERDAGRTINGLEQIGQRSARQKEIQSLWQQLKQPFDLLKQKIDGLPLLPPLEVVQWAQSVLEMVSVSLLEVDTTGLGADDEVVRVALSDAHGGIMFDHVIRPAHASLTHEAAEHNGLTVAEVMDAPLLREAWPDIQRAVTGRYILSYNQDWDVKALKKAADQQALTPLVIIGEDLQRRCNAYYQREYYLDLQKVAARMGYTIESRDALDRLRAQAAILDGIARGITDVSGSLDGATSSVVEAVSTSKEVLQIPDDLGDLEDHPF